MENNNISSLLGQMDIYLIDQLMKGRFWPGMRILDLGAGRGRNLSYFLHQGYSVTAVDREEASLEALQELFDAYPSRHASSKILRGDLLNPLALVPASYDWIFCNAVLHFATDEEAFAAMLENSWAMLKPGGLFFARLTSSIGMNQAALIPLGPSRRYLLPDESERFLVDAEYLQGWERRLGASRIDPLKTSLVEELRAMTTWVLQKKPID